MLERPTTKLSKVRRGSSGEPPSASWFDETGAPMPRGSAASILMSRHSRAAATGSGAFAGVALVRITAERTAMSIRRNEGSSACQHVSTRSP